MNVNVSGHCTQWGFFVSSSTALSVMPRCIFKSLGANPSFCGAGREGYAHTLASGGAMETLVLSTGYEPIARVTWERAVTLLFAGKVEVVDAYDDREIRSVTISFKMPSVIRFLRSLQRKRPRPRFSRENVFLRDQGRCQYCGDKMQRFESTYDHVVPRSKSGLTNWENIVIACMPCNQKKGGRTPEQAGMRLLSKPVRPQKLPNVMRMTFTWEKGMPESWKTWLRDYAYWNVELESDE
jgi:5-methylcytosine-specific restriction endonuclease McrA